MILQNADMFKDLSKCFRKQFQLEVSKLHPSQAPGSAVRTQIQMKYVRVEKHVVTYNILRVTRSSIIALAIISLVSTSLTPVLSCRSCRSNRLGRSKVLPPGRLLPAV